MQLQLVHEVGALGLHVVQRQARQLLFAPLDAAPEQVPAQGELHELKPLLGHVEPVAEALVAQVRHPIQLRVKPGGAALTQAQAAGRFGAGQLFQLGALLHGGRPQRGQAGARGQGAGHGLFHGDAVVERPVEQVVEAGAGQLAAVGGGGQVALVAGELGLGVVHRVVGGEAFRQPCLGHAQQLGQGLGRGAVDGYGRARLQVLVVGHFYLVAQGVAVRRLPRLLGREQLLLRLVVEVNVRVEQRLDDADPCLVEVVGQQLLGHVADLRKLAGARQRVEGAVDRVHQVADWKVDGAPAVGQRVRRAQLHQRLVEAAGLPHPLGGAGHGNSFAAQGYVLGQARFNVGLQGTVGELGGGGLGHQQAQQHA